MSGLDWHKQSLDKGQACAAPQDLTNSCQAVSAWCSDAGQHIYDVHVDTALILLLLQRGDDPGAFALKPAPCR